MASLPYRDPARPVAERVADLLRRMTAEEKIGQLCMLDGFSAYAWNDGRPEPAEAFRAAVAECVPGSLYAFVRADWWTDRHWDNGLPPDKMPAACNRFQRFVMERSRLGIPLFFAEEAPHGLMALGGTVFPTGLGLGAAWDAELMERVGGVVGREARDAGVHVVYGPVLDLARDPRWSRVEECFSEDPLLTARCGAAMVRGLVAEGAVATLKHFAAHGSPEGGHNQGSVHVGPLELFNVHLRPFRAAIAAGARSVMSAYNDVDGEPASGSRRLLTEILRGNMGFDGFVVSDRGAIPRLRHLRLAGDLAEACARALKAGCDVALGNFREHADGLGEALRRGLIDRDDLDRAAGRVLAMKFAAGLFERPYRDEASAGTIGAPEHRDVALECARKAMTLLKNRAGVLPFRNLGALAVIGPNADHAMNQIGDYSAPQRREAVCTVLDGIRSLAAARGVAVRHAPGCRIRLKDRTGFPEALAAARASDAVVLVLGGSSTKYGNAMIRSADGAAVVREVLDSSEMDKESGEGTDRATLGLSGVQLELFRALKATGKPVVAVLVQGRPLVVDELLDEADAVLLAWYPGAAGGRAVAETLFGEYNPAGRLPVTLPRSVGQLPVYYNAPGRRPDYIDAPAEPRLPFGFGLSYTRFRYANLAVDGRTASVEVANVGGCAGEEVVQFYLTALVTTFQRPECELCGFRRLQLEPGETRRVTLELDDECLGFRDRHGDFSLEPGRFILGAGGDSRSLLETEFRF